MWITIRNFLSTGFVEALLNNFQESSPNSKYYVTVSLIFLYVAYNFIDMLLNKTNIDYHLGHYKLFKSVCLLKYSFTIC